MTHFFTELGAGFAFVGRQYRLPVGEEFFIDLLFFISVCAATSSSSLPEGVWPALPSPDELAGVIRDVQRHHRIPET